MDQITNENEIIENEIITDGTETEVALPCEGIVLEPSDADSELDTLKSRISELELLLEEQSSRSLREKCEREEFHKIFPDVDISSLPDEVLAQKESGVPLAAAYALYERIRQNEISAALAANKKNTSSLNSSLTSAGAEPFFSSEDVKKMSSHQVREHFSTIMRSMKHWNR